MTTSEDCSANSRNQDSEGLDRLLERGQGTEVIDARLSLGEMSWRILGESMGPQATESSIWSGIRRGSSVAGIVATLLALVAFLVVGGRPAQRCLRCGLAFCHRCKSDREDTDHCSQCVHLFLKQDGLPPAARR